MDRKTCSMCNIEKRIGDFYNKHTKCKECDTKRSLKSYYENADKISIQQKIYYEKKRDKI